MTCTLSPALPAWQILMPYLDRALWAHAGIRINLGKTQIFNRGNVLPPGCQHILRAGRQLDPPVVVWRSDSVLPSEQQGVTILGTPLGRLDFVKAQLRVKAEEHGVLLNRVEAVSHLQCARLVLSYCCVHNTRIIVMFIHQDLSRISVGNVKDAAKISPPKHCPD